MTPLYILFDGDELVCVGDAPADLEACASRHEARMRRLGLRPRFRTVIQRGIHPNWRRGAA